MRYTYNLYDSLQVTEHHNAITRLAAPAAQVRSGVRTGRLARCSPAGTALSRVNQRLPQKSLHKQTGRAQAEHRRERRAECTLTWLGNVLFWNTAVRLSELTPNVSAPCPCCARQLTHEAAPLHAEPARNSRFGQSALSWACTRRRGPRKPA